jgi:hypothetical protein
LWAPFGDDPFTRADALQAGITADQLRGPYVRRVFRGVYVAAVVPDTLAVRAEAAMMLAPTGSVLSHHTAAALRGLPVPAAETVHVTIPDGRQRLRVKGITAHYRVVDMTELAGWPLTTPVANWCELATALDRDELVVLGDAMVKRQLVSCRALITAAAEHRFYGVRRARGAAVLVRPRVDSPAETRSRLLVVDYGLPEPIAGYVVTDELGERIDAVDLAWPQYLVIIEYDGDLHRTTRSKWRYDNRKRDDLRTLGWTVIVLTADDLTRYRSRTLERIAAALRAGGWTPQGRR